MRISRPCYVTFHRCPGWAGGGLSFAKKTRCDDGRLKRNGNMDAILVGRWWRWRVNRCDTCGLLVLPYAVRWIDPTWLWYRAGLPPLWRLIRDRKL